MYTVANRITVKKGFGNKLAPLFADKSLTIFKGFHKVEVTVSSQGEDLEELNVVTYWESLDDFKAWRESDEFKKAHARDDVHSKGHESSPIVSNAVVIGEVVATLAV